MGMSYENGNGTYTVSCFECGRRVVRYVVAPTVCEECREAKRAPPQPLKSSPYATTFHRDASVTIWDCYRQQWHRTANPSDKLLATLGSDERERVMQHTKE